MTAFVLKQANKLPDESLPSDLEIYDSALQLWIDRRSGLPVVCSLSDRVDPTKFGETVITETREGTDQPEVSSFPESETLQNQTLGALADANDSRLGPTPFGETIETAAIEGTDQPARFGLGASPFGETLITKTGEGTDQREAASILPVPHAFNTHF